MSSHRLALHHLCATEIAAEDLVDIAARLEIPDVTLFLRPPSRRLDIFPTVRDEAEAKRVRARLAATGVGVHDIEAFAIGPRTDIAAFRADLERGASLGARRATALLHDEDEQRIGENFACFCALAREYAIAVTVEFMAYSSLSTLEICAAFIAKSGEPGATLLVDALHLRRTGGLPLDLAKIDPKLIGAAQICDAPLDAPVEPFAEAVENRMIPGEGELPLKDFLEFLPADVPIDMEVPLNRLRDQGVDAFERARRIVEATRKLLGE